MLAAASGGTAGAAAALEPLPGWLARRRKTLRPAADVLAEVPSGPAVPAPRRPAADERDRGSRARASTRCWRRSATATPSATRCSASSARCESAGYESSHLRRDRRSAGSRISRSTTATWSARSPTEDVLIHHFSIGSRASRIAYALPGRMVLIYHNITPPEYFLGVHNDLVQALLPRPARADRVHRPLRARARRLGVQPPGARGARLPRHRRAAGRAGLHATSTSGPDRVARRRLRRRLDQRAVRRPGDPEQEVRGRDPRVSRLPHAPQSARRGCCWSARTADSRRYLDAAARRSSRAWARPTSTSSATSRTRSCRRSTTSPTCSSAPASTKASACRSSRRSTSACRCSPTRRPRCRRRWTAAACSTTRKDPAEIARLMDGDPERRRARGRDRRSRRTRRSSGCRAAISPARCCASSTRLLRAPAPPGARGRLRFLGAVRAVRTARGAPPVPAVALSRAARRDRPRRRAGHDHQPVGAGGASRRRHRRQRARACATCCAPPDTSRSSTR